jgi:hypothetical protein
MDPDEARIIFFISLVNADAMFAVETVYKRLWVELEEFTNSMYLFETICMRYCVGLVQLWR